MGCVCLPSSVPSALFASVHDKGGREKQVFLSSAAISTFVQNHQTTQHPETCLGPRHTIHLRESGIWRLLAD